MGPKFSVEKICIFGKNLVGPKKIDEKIGDFGKNLQVGTKWCPKQIFGIRSANFCLTPPPCLVAEVFVLSDFSRSARNDSRKRSSYELRPHTCNLSTQSLSNVKHLKPYLAKNEALQIEENWEFIHSKCCKLTLNHTYLISSPWLKKLLKFIPSKCFILPLKNVRDFFTQG